MESSYVSPLAATVQALSLLAVAPASSDSRKDLAKQELLRRIELLLQEQQLLRREQQLKEHQEPHWQAQCDHQHRQPIEEHVQHQQVQHQQQDQQDQGRQQQDQQQQEPQRWVSQWEGDDTTQTEVLEHLEEALLLLCCQKPPPALQQQLLRVLLLLVHSTEDCGVWHRVAARLLAAAGEGLHFPPSVSAPLAAAATPPPTAAAAAAAAAGTKKVLSALPPLLLCGELFRACPQALSPLLPLLVAVGSKMLQSPAAPAAATATETAAAVAKALRTAVSATGACGEALAEKLFSLTRSCLRCSAGSHRRSSSRTSSSKTSTIIKSNNIHAASEAAREALLLLQQVVWAFPRGVSLPHGEAFPSAVLAAAAPEPATAASAAENEHLLAEAQENVPHAAAALAALLAAKAVVGMQQHQHQQVKQQRMQVQQQEKEEEEQQQGSHSAIDEPTDLTATSNSASDFASLSLGQCMTAGAAAAAASPATTETFYSEVHRVEDAFTFLRRQWLLLSAGAVVDAKKGSAASVAAGRYVPLLQPQQHGPFLLHLKARQRGLLRQAIAAAVPCLCRFLLRCFSPVSLVSMSLECLFTLLTQLAKAESHCRCSGREGASKGLQDQCVVTCTCCCSCNKNLSPGVCCLSLETLHSQVLVSHAAQQLLPLLHTQQQLDLVDCLSRAIAAAATGVTAPQGPIEARGCASNSTNGGSFTHPLLFRAALNILEATIVAASEDGMVSFPPSLHMALVSILTVENSLQQEQLLRCALWPAVQRQAAACIWRIRSLSGCYSAVYALKLGLMHAATTAAQAALQTTSIQGTQLDALQFAGLWGASLGLAASIAIASPTQPPTPATAEAVAGSSVPAATIVDAATASYTNEGDHNNITALLGLLARGGSEARACFFLLAEALLQLPAGASGAPGGFAAAASSAAFPVGNEDTDQAMLLSPVVCCFLRFCRRALSLSDPRSSISRLLRIASAASAATGCPEATQHTPEAACPDVAGTRSGAGAETPTANTAGAAASEAVGKCLLLELACAFKALTAFLRQHPEAAAATITHDVDTVPDFLTLVIEVSFIVCCCRCGSSNNEEHSLQSVVMCKEGTSETREQQLQQLVCCRCFCRTASMPVVAAYAGLEAAVLEAMSLLPHVQIHCNNQHLQQLLLHTALAAVTIPDKEAFLFPSAAVACCISPIAIAPAAALRAASLEQLQLQQHLVQHLLLQQQQQGAVDPALFIGCGTEVDSLRGPSLWEAQWRCFADATTAAFNALRLPSLVATPAPAEAAVCATETGWRAEYPPQVLRVLQGALLLRRLFEGCSSCSPAADAALQQTAWAACCFWGTKALPPVSLDAPSVHRIGYRSKVEAGKAGTAVGVAGVHHGTSAGQKASRPQHLLQRFGLPRLKKKTICVASDAPFSSDAYFAADRGSSDFPSQSRQDTLQMGIIAAVLSGVFRASRALLSLPLQKHQHKKIPLSAVDTLWCCCEKALSLASPLERLLYADVAGGLYSCMEVLDSPRQQEHQEVAVATGLQAVNKHIEAFLQRPSTTTETGVEELPLPMSSGRLCSVSLLAARLLPLLRNAGSSATTCANDNRKGYQGLLQMAVAATSSIEAAVEVVAGTDTVATAAAKDNVAAARVSSTCALLCVIRLLGVAFPAVASAAAAAARSTVDSPASAQADAKRLSGSTSSDGQPNLQHKQQHVLQQKLFRTLQFAFLLSSSQSHRSRAAMLAAEAARNLLHCLLQHAEEAARAGPDELLSATEDFISHAAREASYILSFSFYCSTDSSNSNISSGTALQLVAAAPALRCLTALVWIQSSSSPARTATAEAEDNTLAAAASSLRALLPVAVAATEFALASPSLVVRREAARSLLSMSLPLGETFWGATIAAAASAAPSKVVAAATGPVVGDPQLSLFILECLNSECDALQRRQLLQLLLQQVRIWGPRNPRQWILLLTTLCCKCVPAPTPTTQPLSTLRSSSSINDARAAGLLQRAQQLLPQTSQVLLSPLATARPLPALTGFVWRPLPGVSAPERVQHQDESCTDVNDSSVNNWSGGEVHPIVCSAAAECLELLLTLPELQQQQQQHWIVPPTDGYQAKYAEVEAASLGGPLLVDCLPLLFRAACQLLWQGTQRHQRQKQQLNGISSDEEISLCRRGLRILLLLLKRLTGVCSGCTTTQLRAAQQLQQHEVAVSSAVSALLRGYATPIAPERHDVPEAATAVAAALAAAAGYMAQAQHRAALLRLKAAATGGDVVQEEQYQQHHQQRLCDQEQRAQLTAMALEVMARFAEAGCCLSPWRLVGQLLLPLGDVVHSASDLVVAASATTPAADPYDWLVRRRLLLACRLLGHITAGAAPSDGAAHSTRAAAVFLEQHHQWVAAIEPCAVPLALHLMACLLKRHREREQQVEQWHQDQQQQEAQQLLKGLALLCHPLSTGGGEKRAAAASAAFAALSAASRSSTARRTVTAPEEAATAPTLAFPEACCPVLNGLADALIQPMETAKSSRESCPAAADWPEAAADEMCWRLESIGTMLLCLCFPPDPEQQQQHQQPHQQQLQPQQLDEDDWAEDWIGADSPTRSHGATTAPADASTVEASENSTGAVWLYPETLRRACEAAGRLAAAAAEAAAAASGLKTHYHCGSGGGGAVSSSLEHGKSHSSGGEETKSAAIEAAQKVELGATPAAVGAAGKIVYGCICFLWKLAGALKQNPAVLSEEAAAFAFFASMRDTSAAALWLPSDSAPLPAVELEEKLRGSMRGAALSLLQRGFSVVAVIPSAPAAASAVSLLLSPLEIPTFLSCFCNGTASGVSPLEAMHLLRSLYETAARAAGAVAAAAAGRTSKTKDTEATAHAANTSLLGHCAGLVESAVASFTGNADFLGTPPAAAAATSTVSSCAAGDTEGVLALAAALVAVDALALTNGPWNRRAMNEQEEQQQQQPGWCARIGTALQRLSEFAYLADSLRNHAALAPAAKTPNSAGATGSPDIVATAETLPPAATRTNPNSSGKITANEREGAADTALVMESSSATATALTEAQAEAGTEAAVVHWPASCQHAAAQLRGFLLRIARLYNQSAAAGPDSFPCLLAAAAVSSLMPALTPYPSVPPRGGTRRTCSKGGRSYRVSKTQLSTIEAQQNHPLKTLEEFLVELSPQNSTAFGGSDLTPLSQVLVAALSSVIAGVLRIQAEACLSPDEGAAGSGEAAPAGLETETIGTATARNSASARLESRAATAEDVAPATAASEVETETAAPKSAVASPESLAVACTAAATETAALPVASLVTDSAAIAAAHLAALEATSDSGAPSSPAGAKTPPSSEAAARPESAGAAEEEPAPAKAPSSTPSGTTETKEPSAARRSAYLAAAASLLYLAVSRHPVVSARAIQAATEAVGEPASAGCTQLVKAAVARLLQEELKRRHHGRP